MRSSALCSGPGGAPYLCGKEGDGDDWLLRAKRAPSGAPHNGRLTARYLTPLVDSLIAETDSYAGPVAEGGGSSEGAEYGHDGAVSDPVVQRYRAARRDPGLALLEGFHALKHALRFGADVVEAVAVDIC